MTYLIYSRRKKIISVFRNCLLNKGCYFFSLLLMLMSGPNHGTQAGFPSRIQVGNRSAVPAVAPTSWENSRDGWNFSLLTNIITHQLVGVPAWCKWTLLRSGVKVKSALRLRQQPNHKDQSPLFCTSAQSLENLIGSLSRVALDSHHFSRGRGGATPGHFSRRSND